MLDRQPVVFNRRAIGVWKQELANIPNEIKNDQERLIPHLTAIQDLHTQLFQVEQILAPIDASISSVQSALSSLEFAQTVDYVQHLTESREEQRRRGLLGNLVETGTDIYRNMTIYDLRSRLAKLQQIRAPHASTKRHLETEIGKQQRMINEIKKQMQERSNRSKELQRLIQAADDFLNKLEHSPQALCVDLLERLENELKIYEKKYPRNQSIVVRLCLAELSIKMRSIYEQELNVEEGAVLNDFWRLKYAQLCGLLWHTFERLNNEAEPLSEHLHSLLLTTHVSKHDDLEAFKLNKSCLILYRQLQQESECSHLLKDMNEEELQIFEEKQYQYSLNDIAQVLNNYQSVLTELNQEPIHTTRLNKQVEDLKDFIEKGRELLEFIEAEKSAGPEPGRPNFDTKFYIEILRQSKIVAENPGRADLRANYKDLANQVEGVPSFGKKLAGLMLAFLGASLIAGAILALVFTSGTSLPFSIKLTVAGASLIAMGLGSFGLGRGLGLFKSGMRHGLSKEMMNFAESAEKVKIDVKARPAQNSHSFFSNNPVPEKGYQGYIPVSPASQNRGSFLKHGSSK